MFIKYTKICNLNFHYAKQNCFSRPGICLQFHMVALSMSKTVTLLSLRLLNQLPFQYV